MSGAEELKGVKVAGNGAAAPHPPVKRWQTAALAATTFLVGAAIALAVALPITHDKWKDSSSSKSARTASLAANSNSSSSSSSSTDASSSGVVREYYIAAERIQWNYTPLGRNNCTGTAFASNQAPSGNNSYTKAVYREYTDNTFKTLKVRPAAEEHLGFYGPILRAEAGDTIKVVFRNLLAFQVNIEPTGVVYPPPPTANPGDTLNYIWRTNEASVASGTTSQMWMYRSTVDAPTHTNAGLAGVIVVTAKGEADAEARPKGVDRELFTIMHAVDETAVPPELQDDSTVFAELEEYAGRRLQQQEKRKLPMLHALNGFIFCNTPKLDMNKGDTVRWYVAGLGNEEDVHTAHWHGVVFAEDGHRLDSVRVMPDVTHTLEMTADNPGTWLLHCHINKHLQAGMMALFNIGGDRVDTSAAVNGTTRKHYIAAEVVEWDYAPRGGDLCHGGGAPANFSDLTFVGSGPDRIGRKYLKALYIEYTDDSFKTRKPRAEKDLHLGLLGPLIRAEVGDKIEVVFLNRVQNHSFTLHPHGVLYAKDGEGSPYNDGTSKDDKADDGVPFGGKHTYTWLVPDRAGPAEWNPSSVLWMYHSHADETMDTYSGLYGGIIVTQQGEARPEDGSPRDVDRELVVMFMVTDETRSQLLANNLAKYLGVAGNKSQGGIIAEALKVRQQSGIAAVQDLALQYVYAANVSDDGTVPAELSDGWGESNLMHNINGFMYCNLPNFTAEVMNSVRVYTMSLGDMEDMHSPALFGSRFLVDEEGNQAMQLLAGGMLTADVTPSAPGKFMLQCQVNDHVNAGMRALLSVNGSTTALSNGQSGNIRRFYIAAEEVEWDYAPLGYDGCSGEAFGEEQQVFTVTTNTTMGSKYRKARYVQYQDNTWATKVDSPGTMGILGPLLQAEVGDIVEIVFKNSLPTMSASVKFTGGLVPVSAQSLAAGEKLPSVPAGPKIELAPYDGRRRRLAAAPKSKAKSTTSTSSTNVTGVDAVIAELQKGVNPGGSALYRWAVPSYAGPSSGDSAGLVAYTYISGVDEISSTYAGMIGVIAIARLGGFDANKETTLNSTATNTTAAAAAPYDGRRRLQHEAVRAVPSVRFITPLLFMYMNENESPYLEHNLKTAAKEAGIKSINTTDEKFAESNLMHSVNGRVYCNLAALRLKQGETGILILVGMGSEEMHTPVFNGLEVQVGETGSVATSLLPSVTRVAMVTGGAPGSWKAYCAVADHLYAGMTLRVVVNEQEVDASSSSSSSSDSSSSSSPSGDSAAAAPYDGRRRRLLRSVY